MLISNLTVSRSNATPHHHERRTLPTSTDVKLTSPISIDQRALYNGNPSARHAQPPIYKQITHRVQEP